MASIPFPRRLALELLVQGEPMDDVAVAVGVSITTVNCWIRPRRTNRWGVPPKSACRRLAETLLREGWTEADLARETGISATTLSQWRSQAGIRLLPRGPRKGERRLRGEVLLRQGMRDTEIAGELGVSREAVRRWRIAAGMRPSRRRRPSQPYKIDGFLWLGVPLKDIARRVNVSLAVVSQRRRALGLSTGAPVRSAPPVPAEAGA